MQGICWQRKTRLTVRLLMSLAILAVLLVLVYVNVSPFGARVVLKLTPGEQSRSVSFEKPFSTTSELGTDSQGKTYQIPRLKMTTDEVTFNLEVPYESFKTMEARIRYSGNPDKLDIGVHVPSTGYQYGPINNSSLNELKWDSIEDNGLTLYQKQKKYETIGKFLEALPGIVSEGLAMENKTRVTTYFYKPTQPPPAMDKSTADLGTRIDYTLRGPHTFYVYTEDGAARFSFKKQELNDYQGEDTLTLHIYDESDLLVYSQSVPDDGDSFDDHKPSAPRRVDVAPPRLSPGTYRLEFICNNDVLIKDIISSERYLCAANRVFLADNYIYQVGPSKPSTLYSDAKVLTAEVWNPESIQTVVVNDSLSINVAQLFNPVSVSLVPGVKSIKTELGGIILSAPDAFIAFSEGSLFDPLSLKTSAYNQNINQKEYDYIITGYTRPRRRGDFMEQLVRLNMVGVRPEGNLLKFSLSAPGLSQKHGEVVIDYLEITLDR